MTFVELIEDVLAHSREADPHVIARRLLPRLSEDDLTALALRGLVDQVSTQIRRVREGGVGGRPGPSRWQVAQRVCVEGTWKLLANCTATDLETLAGQHRDLAAKNLARADEYHDLATAVRRAGVETVGALWTRQETLAA